MVSGFLLLLFIFYALGNERPFVCVLNSNDVFLFLLAVSNSVKSARCKVTKNMFPRKGEEILFFFSAKVLLQCYLE